MDNEARGMVAYDGEAGPVQTYLARPSAEEPRPAVIVIHEIVGLTEHIKRVADRFAESGIFFQRMIHCFGAGNPVVRYA